jgi:prevent-host-death family protein
MVKKTHPSERVVGAFEAKTHLSRLLSDAQRGIVTVVTVRGKPAARIVPVGGDSSSRKRVVEELLVEARKLRARARAGPESLHDLVNAGRRR